MRLHSLRMRAFGPFAAEQVVDFDRLGAGGLFLLDGPTGAGKSTVLDAVTFALYGPGERGGDGRLQSGFAEPGAAPEVVLEFSVRGRRHRVTRTPEYERPKRRGTGTTKVAASVHLERDEQGAWVSRSANKAEVAALLAGEIGLTRAQFTQVVLLPQGEFATFLRAGDDERRTLLTSLFTAHLYDRITDELERRRVEAVRHLDADREQVQGWLAAVAEAARLDAETRADLLVAGGRSGGDSGDPIDGVAADLDTAERQCRERAREASARSASARDAADLAQRALEDALAADEARSELAAHERERAGHAQRVAELELARAAAPVGPLLADAAEADTRLRAVRASLPEPDADDPDAPLAGELEDAAARNDAEAAALEHLAEQERGWERQVGDLAAAAADLTELQAAVEPTELRLRTLPDLIAAAQREHAVAAEGAARVEPLRERQALLRERLRGAREADELAPRVSAARVTLDTASDAYHAAADEQFRLQEARLAGIAAELSAGLRAGQPCPVCGGADHPYPARTAPGAVSGAAVAAATELREQAEAARDSARSAHEALALGYATAIERAGGADIASLTTETAALDADLVHARELAAGLPSLGERLVRLEEEAGRDRASRAELGERRAALTARHDALAAGVARLETELRGAAGGDPDVAARQSRLRSQAAKLRERAGAARALQAAREQALAALARAASEARNRGFPGADDAAAALRDPDRVAALERAVAQWQQVDAALQAAPALRLDAAEVEVARPAAAAAAAALQEADAAAEAAARTAELAADTLARFAAARDHLDRARDALAERERQARPVIHLARLARGVAGERRVALTTFVLRYWFEHVVAAANLRLAMMSGGRYELVRVDEGTRATERAGLTLEVLDRYTGRQRSARSLSGGETFYTSLALALGLADVVRAEAGGADLDTLFIDEGFGSLDADTLEEVMAVLDDLRGGGRVVGIVSHVADLKDRIPERLEVRRRADGSSEVRVVA